MSKTRDLLAPLAADKSPECGDVIELAKQATLADSITKFFCSTSSLAIGVPLFFVDERIPGLFYGLTVFLMITSLGHHGVEELVPSERGNIYEFLWRIDAAAIAALTTSFYALLFPGLGLGVQLAVAMGAGAIGYFTRWGKTLTFTAGAIGTFYFQPDVIGIIATGASFVMCCALFGIFLHDMRWRGPIHLWAWHSCSAVSVFLTARALMAAPRYGL